MPCFAVIREDGTIGQVAIGFDESPFPNGQEVNSAIANEPDRWVCKEGQWQYYPEVSLQMPDVATVGEQIVVNVSISEVTPTVPEAVVVTDKVALLIDGEHQALSNSFPISWGVIFETPGTYLVEVDAGRHGRFSREVVVS